MRPTVVFNLTSSPRVHRRQVYVAIILLCWLRWVLFTATWVHRRKGDVVVLVHLVIAKSLWPRPEDLWPMVQSKVGNLVTDDECVCQRFFPLRAPEKLPDNFNSTATFMRRPRLV